MLNAIIQGVVFNCSYSEPPVARSSNRNGIKLGKETNDVIGKKYSEKNIINSKRR